MFNTVCTVFTPSKSVLAKKKMCLSAEAAVQLMLFRLILYGKNIVEQKFQVQRNGEAGQFSEPGPAGRTSVGAQTDLSGGVDG